MLYAVNLTIEAEKTLIVEANSRAEAAGKVRRKEQERKHLLEEGEFTVICGTSGVRELRGNRK